MYEHIFKFKSKIWFLIYNLNGFQTFYAAKILAEIIWNLEYIEHLKGMVTHLGVGSFVLPEVEIIKKVITLLNWWKIFDRVFCVLSTRFYMLRKELQLDCKRLTVTAHEIKFDADLDRDQSFGSIICQCIFFIYFVFQLGRIRLCMYSPQILELKTDGPEH